MREPTARPPEWWTAENTEAWAKEVWGDKSSWGDAMRAWGDKFKTACGRAGAVCYRPLTAKELIEARAKDSRPANRHYYDGTWIEDIRPLTVKRASKRARQTA
jgi:hypothetical protein